MKKLSTRALFAALLLGGGLLTSSCEKEINPEQSIDAETALSDEQGIQTAVVGAYSRLYQPALYGTNLIIIPDLLASPGYLSWQGSFQSYREISSVQITTVNADVQRTWRDAYRVININNLVLEALPTIRDAAQRQELQGEMQLMRGLMHFELVRLYGQPAMSSTFGVPVVTRANRTVDEASQRLPRNTVQQVYDQVISDMRAAEQALPEENDAGRFDRYDAKALLARVYLQMGNYAQARDLANDVIQNSGATLNASVLDAFTSDGSPEVLFEVLQNEQNNAGQANDGLATFYSGKSVGFQGRADVAVSAAFAGRYEASDVRGDQGNIGDGLLYLGDAARPGQLRSYKWNDFAQNIPVIRLAEMLLTRAEANRRLGTTTGATPLADVNAIRQRAGATPLTAVTVEDILLERELELAYEGFRIHDYRRTGRQLGANPSTADARVLPIPQYEINLGNATPQTPGYM
ncbi:RagB/SusD family nutrient uptake outer membrane protein [Hymenobacter coalescens]